ncbi:MAG TPA: hypothetical protein VFX49_00820 [Chloroflexota bacterium]|nr:hypothetical protein [Chloroflexota bacterium]
MAIIIQREDTWWFADWRRHAAAIPGAVLRTVDAIPSWAVALAAVLLGNWALVLFAAQGLSTVHGDALARLNISRRMVDSLTPSFAQLGGIWLPLPQLLMALTVGNDYMWQTGLAGSGVSVLAFAAGTGFVHAIVRALSRSGVVALLGAAIFATNANLLFMQATPMTEPLTILTVLGTTYHLLRWAQGRSLLHLIGSSVWVFAGSLTRYEAWVLLPVGCSAVALTALLRHRNIRQLEGLALSWVLPAAYGIVLWVLYNWIIFGDPLNFSLGPGSAKAFSEAEAAAGRLPTRHNPLYAFLTYYYATIDNTGLPLFWGAVAGLVVLAISRLSIPEKLAALVPWSIFAFEVTSLTAGQSVLWTPQLAPYDFYNVRYGLLMMPAVAVGAACLTLRLRPIALLALITLVALQIRDVPHLAEARDATYRMVESVSRDDSRGLSGKWIAAGLPLVRAQLSVTLVDAVWAYEYDANGILEAAAFLRDHATSGKILVSAATNDRLMFSAGLPMSRYVSEGIKPYFSQEMDSPGLHTDWIVVRPLRAFDAIRPLIRSGAPRGFVPAFQNEHYTIYERVGRLDEPGQTPAPVARRQGHRTLISYLADALRTS